MSRHNRALALSAFVLGIVIFIVSWFGAQSEAVLPFLNYVRFDGSVKALGAANKDSGNNLLTLKTEVENSPINVPNSEQSFGQSGKAYGKQEQEQEQDQSNLDDGRVDPPSSSLSSNSDLVESDPDLSSGANNDIGDSNTINQIGREDQYGSNENSNKTSLANTNNDDYSNNSYNSISKDDIAVALTPQPRPTKPKPPKTRRKNSKRESGKGVAGKNVIWENYNTFRESIVAYNGTLPCKDTILNLAFRLHKQLEKRKTGIPLIIGGIGDSGTRSLVDFLEAFNVSFGKRTYSRDSVAFMKYYTLDSCSVVNTSRTKAGDIYTGIMGEPGVFAMNFDEFSGENRTIWYSGLQITLRIMLEQLRLSSNDAPFISLKQPRSTLFLPFMKTIFGHQLRYIHLLRDPRDLAAGTFPKFYRDLCRYFYDSLQDLRQCNGGIRNRLEFDARYNLEAVEWLTRNLQANQYLVTRIEDLVNTGNEKCLQRIIDFIKLDHAGWETPYATLQEQAQNFAKHNASFCGRKFSALERTSVNKGSLVREKVLETIRQLGYQVPVLEHLDDLWIPSSDCGVNMSVLSAKPDARRRYRQL